jgi:hypothetical protein
MIIRFVRICTGFKVGDIVELSDTQALWFVRNAVAVKHVERPVIPVVKYQPKLSTRGRK